MRQRDKGEKQQGNKGNGSPRKNGGKKERGETARRGKESRRRKRKRREEEDKIVRFMSAKWPICEAIESFLRSV